MPLMKPGQIAEVPAPEPVEVDVVARPTVVQVAISKEERISRAGVWQACVQAQFLANTAASLEQWRELVDAEAVRLLRVINKEA